MAIYHLHVKIWNRGEGKGAGGHARYILRQGPYAETITERVDGNTLVKEKISRAEEVVFSASAHMPEWVVDPLDYWDAADQYERANGTVYREIEFALPEELSPKQNAALATAFADTLSDVEMARLPAGQGVTPYTLAIHRSEKNPRLLHCHLMLNDRVHDGSERSPALWFRRAVNAGSKKDPALGGAPKTRVRKSKEWLRDYVRPLWAHMANAVLQAAGHTVRIDHRTLEVQRQEQEQFAKKRAAAGDQVGAARAQAAARLLDRPAQPKRGRVLEHRGPKKAPGQAALWDVYVAGKLERKRCIESLQEAETAAEQRRRELVRAEAVWHAAWLRQSRDFWDEEEIRERWRARQKKRREREARREAAIEAACLALEQKIVDSLVDWKYDQQQEPWEDVHKRWADELDAVCALGVSEAVWDAVYARAMQRGREEIKRIDAGIKAQEAARRAAKRESARRELQASHQGLAGLSPWHGLSVARTVVGAVIGGCQIHRQAVAMRWAVRRNDRIARLRERIKQQRIALERGQVNPLAPMARARFFAGLHRYYTATARQGRSLYQVALQADLDVLQQSYSVAERAAKQAVEQSRRAAKREAARRELQASHQGLAEVSPRDQLVLVVMQVARVLIQGCQVRCQDIRARWAARREERIARLREQIQEICADLRDGRINVRYLMSQDDLLDELPWYYDEDTKQWMIRYQAALQADLDALDAQYQALEQQAKQEDEDESTFLNLQYDVNHLLKKINIKDDPDRFTSALRRLGCTLDETSGCWVHGRQGTPLESGMDTLLDNFHTLKNRYEKLHILMQAVYDLALPEQRHVQGQMRGQYWAPLSDKRAYDNARWAARRADIAEAVLTEARDRMEAQARDDVARERQVEATEEAKRVAQDIAVPAPVMKVDSTLSSSFVRGSSRRRRGL